MTILLEIRRLQIPRHTRQPDDQTIQLLAHLDLAAQAAGLGEAKRQVEHVVLVVIWLLHLVVHVLAVDNDVACAACAGAAACAFHLEVVGLCDVEQVVAVCDGEGVGLAVFVDEGYVALFTRLGGIEVAMAGCWGGGEGSRGDWL